MSSSLWCLSIKGQCSGARTKIYWPGFTLAIYKYKNELRAVNYHPGPTMPTLVQKITG